jgi:hypothetical protein
MSYQRQGLDDTFSGVIRVGDGGAGTYAQSRFPSIERFIILICLFKVRERGTEKGRLDTVELAIEWTW